MKYGNCWLFALPKWLKNPRKSYLVVRLSKHSYAPHVFFAESIANLVVEEFKPANPQRGFRGMLHKLWFKGRIRKGVGEE